MDRPGDASRDIKTDKHAREKEKRGEEASCKKEGAAGEVMLNHSIRKTTWSEREEGSDVWRLTVPFLLVSHAKFALRSFPVSCHLLPLQRDA